MQSIVTKYLGPTNHRGGRVKARASWAPHTVIVSYDSSLSQDENHDRAALELLAKLGWDGIWHRGSAGADGNVYVCQGEKKLVVT